MKKQLIEWYEPSERLPKNHDDVIFIASTDDLFAGQYYENEFQLFNYENDVNPIYQIEDVKMWANINVNEVLTKPGC